MSETKVSIGHVEVIGVYFHDELWIPSNEIAKITGFKRRQVTRRMYDHAIRGLIQYEDMLNVPYDHLRTLSDTGFRIPAVITYIKRVAKQKANETILQLQQELDSY